MWLRVIALKTLKAAPEYSGRRFRLKLPQSLLLNRGSGVSGRSNLGFSNSRRSNLGRSRCFGGCGSARARGLTSEGGAGVNLLSGILLARRVASGEGETSRDNQTSGSETSELLHGDKTLSQKTVT